MSVYPAAPSGLSPAEKRQLIVLQRSILQTALRTQDPREAVSEICRLAEPLLPHSVATVLLLDTQGILQVYAAPSVPQEAQEQLRDLRPGPEAGSCGNAILRQEPVFVTDTLTDPRWRLLRPLALDFGIMACWSVPLRNQPGEILGTFALSSFESRSPSPFHVEILETAAAAISLILERDRLEEQLRIQSQALESLAEGVLLTDSQGKIRWANARFARITGYSLAEIQGQSCAFMQGPETDPATKAAIRRALDAAAPFQGVIRNYRKDGTPYWNELDIVPVHDRQGTLTHFVSIQRDVSAAKQSEEDLRIAAKAFEVREGIMITDAQRRIIRVNAAFTWTTGYTLAEVRGQTPRILHSGRQDPSFYQAMWDHINNTGSWSGEIWNRRKNGEIYPERLTITAVTNERGEVTHYVAYFTDITRRKQQEAQLEHLALHDALTDLPNRAQFEQQISALLRELRLPSTVQQQGTAAPHERRHRKPAHFLAVGILDLDGFKEVNDTLGHAAGDQLLRRLAQEFRRMLRTHEGVARLGGDEFGFHVRLSDPDELQAISERILAMVVAAARDLTETPVTGSLGWAYTPLDGMDYASLLVHADEAMYAAKEQGKSTWRLYHGAVQEAAERRIYVHSQVPRAISQGDLVFFLQPQADLLTGNIIGAELLARWRQPNGRWMFPGKFMPHIEQDTHLLRVLGIHGLLEAQQLRGQLQARQREITLSVNIGGKHFLHRDFLDDVAEFCPDGTGITIEITESTALSDLKRARAIAEALKERGFGLSMDDFGTGYSSLYHVTQLPFDEIKLDQSFIRHWGADYHSYAVAGAALLLSELSGKSLIAEGVSTPRAQEIWLRMGGRRIQGYNLAPPLPKEAFLTWFTWFLPSRTARFPTLALEDLPILFYLYAKPAAIQRLAKVDASECTVGIWIHTRCHLYAHLPVFQAFVSAHETLHSVVQQQKGKTEVLAALRELKQRARGLLQRLEQAH